MEWVWLLMTLGLILLAESRAALMVLVRHRERAQSTVEYGAALLGIAAAAIAIWLLFGPALGQLGQRMVNEVNSVK